MKGNHVRKNICRNSCMVHESICISAAVKKKGTFFLLTYKSFFHQQVEKSSLKAYALKFH